MGTACPACRGKKRRSTPQYKNSVNTLEPESEPAAATEVAADARLLQSFSRQMLRGDRDLAVLQQCISDALEERHALLTETSALLLSGLFAMKL